MQRQIKREKMETPTTIYRTIDITSGDNYTIQRIEIPESEYEDAVAAGSIQVIEADPDEEHDDDDVHVVHDVHEIEEEEEEQEIEESYNIIEEDVDPDEEDIDTREFTVIPKPAAGTSSKSKAHYCPNCGNCYGAAGSLKLHIRACLKQKETEERATEARKCHICGRVYNSTSYLKEHILRHTGKGPKKCPRCPRKFMDQNKYDAHVKTHANDEQIRFDPDDDCSIQEHNSPDKKVIKEYTCSFCQKKFTVVFDSRNTKRRYACDECREKFTNEENLRKHKESLEEKKDFRCERCGRKFVFEGFLQRHTPTCDGTIKRKRDRV